MILIQTYERTIIMIIIMMIIIMLSIRLCPQPKLHRRLSLPGECRTQVLLPESWQEELTVLPRLPGADVM